MKQITIIEDGSVIIKHHYIEGIVHKPYKRHIRRKHDKSEVMLVKEYNKKIGQWRGRLKNLKIDESRSLFFTMTISDKIYNDQDVMNTEFDNVVKAIKEEFEIRNIDYVKVFQIQLRTNNLHIHSILQFPSIIFTDIEQHCNTDWLKEHWTLGAECCVKNVYEVTSLINYLADKIKKSDSLVCFNEDIELDYRERRTICQKGKHIVSVSKNFPKQRAFRNNMTENEYVSFKENNRYKHKGFKYHIFNGGECLDEEYLWLDVSVKSFDETVKELSEK